MFKNVNELISVQQGYLLNNNYFQMVLFIYPHLLI